jgi:aspartyl-tRNA(Asn)/glutamyl-tRNA(Gln) amidotransferase subunit A
LFSQSRHQDLFTFSSITHYHADLLNGTTTCVAAVQHFLHNIEQKRHLNAYLQVYDQEALQLAASLDAERAAGKV